MRIEVTKEDIKAGVQNRSSACPIALAVGRQCPWLEWPGVGTTLLYFNANSRRQLPEEAVRFVDKFDEGEPVEPFAFDIDIPEA